MFNYETIQHFLKRDSTDEQRSYAIEQAKEILKKYECFAELLNGKEELFQKCKDIMLKDLLLATRSSSAINRDYIIGYQDAIEVFLRNLDSYKGANDVILSKEI